MESGLKTRQTLSLPLWECGLKLGFYERTNVTIGVTPFVGVWIEMGRSIKVRFIEKVTPFVGVWIEIICRQSINNTSGSLPLWECGLKCVIIHCADRSVFVTPFVGVWIEIDNLFAISFKKLRHSLCGSVD